MIRATFAVPGDLTTPTGGYSYARRLLAEAAGVGISFRHLALPGGFPEPSGVALSESRRLLEGLPSGQPILIDGLVLGVLPTEMLLGLPGPLVGLCHHPLALETGVEAEAAERLHGSERAALAVCAQVVATSATTAAVLADDFGVPEGRLTVACPGTEAAARAMGSGGPGVEILSVGSLTPRKGHEVLIAALAGLAHLDWRLTIAGPADRDSAHANDLDGRINAAGLRDRIALAGALDQASLERAYASADLFVLASRYEGFGMAYAEAMARGLPVVGCAAGAVAEATRGAACLVAPGDAAALGAVLEPLITDRAARARLADKCWQAAAGFQRWPDTAAIIATVLRRAAA